MVRRETVAAIGAVVCAHLCTLGLCWRGEVVIGDVFWCKHLVATRGAFVRRDGVVRERQRMAVRGTDVEAILWRNLGIYGRKYGGSGAMAKVYGCEWKFR
jgi:hypothetical protein